MKTIISILATVLILSSCQEKYQKITIRQPKIEFGNFILEASNIPKEELNHLTDGRIRVKMTSKTKNYFLPEGIRMRYWKNGKVEVEGHGGLRAHNNNPKNLPPWEEKSTLPNEWSIVQLGIDCHILITEFAHEEEPMTEITTPTMRELFNIE